MGVQIQGKIGTGITLGNKDGTVRETNSTKVYNTITDQELKDQIRKDGTILLPTGISKKA